MVEVFKTDVAEPLQAKFMKGKLEQKLALKDVHFDLADRDNILRIESAAIDAAGVIAFVKQYGYSCEVLED